MRNPFPLIISAGGSPGAYDIVRALGKAGIHSAVASSDSHDIAFASRWCAERIILPALTSENDPAVVNVLVGMAQRQTGKPVLYFASDAELSFVCRNREMLDRSFTFLLPDTEIVDQLFNKVRFSSFARLHGVPIPDTIIVPTVRDLASVIDAISFPCIVKPAFSQDWVWDTREQELTFGPYKKALRRISSRESLETFCKALPSRSSGFLIQSYVEGRDEQIVSFHGYFDERSSCLGWFLGTKIRTFPMHTGGSCFVRTIVNEDLANICIGYLERMRFSGPVKIDLKWNEERKQYIVLEINPRYNLWHVLGAYAGVNIPFIAYRHQTGSPIPAWDPHIRNERLLYFKQDLRAFIEGYRISGEWTWRTYVRSLFWKKRYRVFDPQDIAPFIVSMTQFTARNAARFIARALGILRSLVTRHNATVSAKDKQEVGVILHKGIRP